MIAIEMRVMSSAADRTAEKLYPVFFVLLFDDLVKFPILHWI